MTTAELLQALADATISRAPKEPTDVFTGSEIRQATGWCSARFTREMGVLKRDGRLEFVKVQREAVDGRRAAVTAYRILRATKKRG